MTDLTPREPNIPLLRKAVEWAEAEHARTDGKGAWHQGIVAQVDESTHCGTAYCIAGYVLVQEGYSIAEASGYIDGVDSLDVAAELLGIPEYGHAVHLFDPCNDIHDIRRMAEELAGERL